VDPDLRKKSADRYGETAYAIRQVLDQLTRSTLEHLIRASEQTAQVDGYPVNTSGDEDQLPSKPPQHDHLCPQIDGYGDCICGAVSVSDGIGRPAENAAIQMATSRATADPVKDTALEALAILVEMAGLAHQLRKKLPVVIKAADGFRGRPTSTGTCIRCGGSVSGVGNDRIRKGFGPTCYERYKYLGMPDRQEFISSFTDDDRRCGDALDEAVVVATFERIEATKSRVRANTGSSPSA